MNSTIQKLIPAFFITLLLSAGLGLLAWHFRPAPPPPVPSYGIFEWREEAVEDPGPALRLSKVLGASRWYQEFYEDLEYGDASAFVTALGEEGVEVYALIGASEWGFEEDAASLIGAMQPIVDYNRSAGEGAKIRGVMADVEPYIRSRWKKDPEAGMDLYLSCMEHAYRFAQENGLIFINCIPRHYDDQGLTVGLEKLIGLYCDEAAVMNYGCGSEVEAIATEADIAKRWGKPLHCILEFQRVGKHGLTEDETYSNKGIPAAKDTWRAVAEAYPDVLWTMDYHYALPMEEILNPAEGA